MFNDAGPNITVSALGTTAAKARSVLHKGGNWAFVSAPAMTAGTHAMELRLTGRAYTSVGVARRPLPRDGLSSSPGMWAYVLETGDRFEDGTPLAAERVDVPKGARVRVVCVLAVVARLAFPYGPPPA